MRTIIELPSGILAQVHRRPRLEGGFSACCFCDFQGCGRCKANGACLDYDTPTMSTYLERLAKPKLRLNTPSEARREAAGK